MQCLDIYKKGLQVLKKKKKNPWIKIQYFIYFSPKKQATQN